MIKTSSILRRRMSAIFWNDCLVFSQLLWNLWKFSQSVWKSLENHQKKSSLECFLINRMHGILIWNFSFCVQLDISLVGCAHSWDVTREVSSSLSTRTNVLSSIVNTFVLGPSVNRRHSTCVDLGWVAKRWKTCFDLVQIWSLLKWAQVIASQRRRKQALAKLERGSQVDTSFQLVSTCESVGQGFKLAHFLTKTWRFVCTLHTVLKVTVTAVCFSLFLES